MLAENVIARNPELTYWGGTPPVFFILDFGKYEIFLTDYTLRNGNAVPFPSLSDWKLEGSKDGIDWVDVHEQRDFVFKAGFESKTFHVTDGRDFFRYWKLSYLGKRSDIGLRSFVYIYLCGFEMYGHVRWFTA
jgi:hypothetical protein